MLRDRDALICDFAQYYHITDIGALPVRTLAALSFGLPEESRSKLKLAGHRYTTNTLLLAIIADRLGTLVWMNSEDGQQEINRPKSILQMLLGEEPGESEVQSFDSEEEFERVKNKILTGGNEL